MTIAELISLFIASTSLLISGFTAYKTFVTKFKGSIYIRPRIILNRVNDNPTLVVGCEMFNSSSKPGLIDDIVMSIRFRQSSGKGLDRYTFYPDLMREDFMPNRQYLSTDFEPFQSIPVSANSRIVKYIIFSSGSYNFSPSAGEGDIEIRFRCSSERRWLKVNNAQITLKIDASTANGWGDPKGKVIMVETSENSSYRNDLLESL